MSLRALLFALLLCLCSGTAISAEQNIAVVISATGDTFVVEATIKAPVTLRRAWEVLVDFDQMASILSNLTSSKVLNRNGNSLIVMQEGVAKYGLFSYSFRSEREIYLEPMKRIVAKNLSGTFSRMESETKLSQLDQGQGVKIQYRAEVVPDSVLARMFGAPFLHHEVEEQFQLMVAEMIRREGLTDH